MSALIQPELHPVLSIDRNGSNQTGLTGGTFNKISFTNVVVDTLIGYDSATNFRYTPIGKAGWYLFDAQVQSQSNAESCQASIYKNGTAVANGLYIGAGLGSTFLNSPVPPKLVYLNGSTDYVEFFVYLPSGITTLSGAVVATYATGVFISP